MKYLLGIGLFCVGLMCSGCSTSFEGGYEGELSVSGIVAGKSWTDSENGVIALVKREGGESTLELAETSMFKNCTALREGATCSVDVDGATESLVVESVNYQSREKVLGPGGVAIFIQGMTKQSQTFLRYDFKGLPYGKE